MVVIEEEEEEGNNLLLYVTDWYEKKKFENLKKEKKIFFQTFAMEKLGSSRASQQMGPTHYFIMLWTAAWGHSGFVVVFFFQVNGGCWSSACLPYLRGLRFATGYETDLERSWTCVEMVRFAHVFVTLKFTLLRRGFCKGTSIKPNGCFISILFLFFIEKFKIKAP